MWIYQEGLYYIFCFKFFNALRITAKQMYVCKCNTADFLLGSHAKMFWQWLQNIWQIVNKTVKIMTYSNSRFLPASPPPPHPTENSKLQLISQPQTSQVNNHS